MEVIALINVIHQCLHLVYYRVIGVIALANGIHEFVPPCGSPSSGESLAHLSGRPLVAIFGNYLTFYAISRNYYYIILQ